MNLRLDDDLLDPDSFLKLAIEAKIEYLNKKLEELLVAGKRPEEVERLSAARAEFLEVLRSPRLYLSKPASATSPEPTAASEAEPPKRPASILPKGAIPQPKRFSASTPAAAVPATTAAPESVAAKPPSAKAKSGGGGMMSFLKSVQTSTAAASAPKPPAAPEPVAPVAAPPAAVTPPVRPVVAPVDSGPKGPMLSFLEKMKQDSSDLSRPVAPPSSAAPREAGVLELLKERASVAGFKDVYEMLTFKKERLLETMTGFENTPAAAKIREVIEEEIREIDELMKLRPTEIAKKVKEFQEVAAVDKGGLAAIQEEISDLLDEIK